MSASSVVYTCDDHSSVYHHLSADRASSSALTHLDAHCDLRGTLIDLDTGRAWLRSPGLPLSASTYLSHLVAERGVTDLEWVHDEIGGRINDLRTVLYTSDLNRLLYRWVSRPQGPATAITYRESDYAGWRHRDAQRVLDIDWDFFADWRKDAVRTQREIEALLEEKIEVAPLRTYVAYSSPYSRPSRAAYVDFVERLARRLSARLEPIPEASVPRAGSMARALPPALRRLLKSQAVQVKRALLSGSR